MGRLPASVTTQHSLADLVELQRGYDLTAAERMPGEIPVIGGGGPNGTHNAANVSGPGVVVVRSGSGFGNVWWVKEDFWAHNTVMFAKSFKGNHKRFAYYVLDWLDFTSYNSGGAQPSLNRNFIYSIPIFLPSPTEQERIAGIIEIWDRAIETVEALIANARVQKQALMQQLLPQGTTPPKKRLPGFSGEWKRLTLAELGTISSAGVDKKIIEGEADVRLLNFLDAYNREFIYDADLKHHVTAPKAKVQGCNVSKGDVFFTPSSETRDDIALAAVAAEDMPGVVYSYHVVRFRLIKKLDLNFSAYLFQTGDFKRQAHRLGDGSGQRYVISQPNFRKMQVSVPGFDEQVAIGGVLADHSTSIADYETQLTALRQEKAALMQQLLTGKRRVKLPESEAA